MAHKFVKGHKYVFSPKKYSKSLKKLGMKPYKAISTKANGQDVDPVTEKTANGFVMLPEWCKEVR